MLDFIYLDEKERDLSKVFIHFGNSYIAFSLYNTDENQFLNCFFVCLFVFVICLLGTPSEIQIM